jgi:cytochrome c5
MARALFATISTTCAALALTVLAAGCAGTGGAGASAPSSGAPGEGERLWRSKCGACHVPVAPATRERAQLETALGRHRTRVRMSEPEWRAVIDFLARPTGSAAR